MCFSSLCRDGLGDTPITDEVFSEFDHSSQREFGLAFRNSCAYGIECEDDPLDWRTPDWYAPRAAFGHSATYDGLFTEKDSAAEWYQSEATRWYQEAANPGVVRVSITSKLLFQNILPPPITNPGSLFFHNHVRSKAAASSATAGTGSSRDGPLELHCLGVYRQTYNHQTSKPTFFGPLLTSYPPKKKSCFAGSSRRNSDGKHSWSTWTEQTGT